MTIPSDPPNWELIRRDGTLLGRLTQDGLDPPWVLCRFEPTEHFAPVAHLFAEEIGLLEEDEMDNWAAVEEDVAALGLELRPSGGGTPIREFLLHVDGSRAWFRS